MVNGNLLQPFRGELRFYYRCPECNGEFFLDHKSLKVEEEIYETKCCFCEAKLPLRVLLDVTCATKWKTSIIRKVEKAVSVLIAQGYSKKDAIRLVETVDVETNGMELSIPDIIRQAIGNDIETKNV